MISKKITQIEFQDLKQLVESNVLELKTLEYKSALPGDKDSDKKEFLADISSFANTLGGDVVYGINEDRNNGKLGSEIGLEVPNLDKVISRLENLVRDGISPRINVDVKAVPTQEDRVALVIRVKPSMEKPHRVVYGGSDKFFMRNSNGKYQMDVNELRSAFLKSSDMVNQVKQLRKNRVFDVKAGDTPIPLTKNSSFLIVHIFPLSSFSNPLLLTSRVLSDLDSGVYSGAFSPVNKGAGWSHRINIDGVVAYSGGDPTRETYTYTQLYRNGIIEGVCPAYIQKDPKGIMTLSIGAIEKTAVDYVKQMIHLLTELGFSPPFYVFLAITNVKGLVASKPTKVISLDVHPIDVEDLVLPEVIIEEISDNHLKKLKPIFDIMWNSSGVSSTPNYDDEGNVLS